MPNTDPVYRCRTSWLPLPDSTRPLAGTARASLSRTRHRSNRLQNRLMHLFRIDTKSSRVGFHDCDSAHEALAALALLIPFLGERENLVLEIILLDCCTGDDRIFSLPLLGRVDLAIEPVLVQRGWD